MTGGHVSAWRYDWHPENDRHVGNVVVMKGHRRTSQLVHLWCSSQWIQVTEVSIPWRWSFNVNHFPVKLKWGAWWVFMTGARVQWKLLHLAPFTLAPTSVTQIALTIPGVSHSKLGLIDSSWCSGCQAKGSESALIKGNSVNTRKDNLGGSIGSRWKQLHLLITILIRWKSPGQSGCSYNTLLWSTSPLNGDSGHATSVLWI